MPEDLGQPVTEHDKLFVSHGKQGKIYEIYCPIYIQKTAFAKLNGAG
jgi:hypothetical protein